MWTCEADGECRTGWSRLRQHQGRGLLKAHTERNRNLSKYLRVCSTAVFGTIYKYADRVPRIPGPPAYENRRESLRSLLFCGSQVFTRRVLAHERPNSEAVEQGGHKEGLLAGQLQGLCLTSKRGSLITMMGPCRHRGGDSCSRKDPSKEGVSDV